MEKDSTGGYEKNCYLVRCGCKHEETGIAVIRTYPDFAMRTQSGEQKITRVADGRVRLRLG
jgi:hypothetical protein